MKVNYGPIETEVSFSISGMIAIDQYMHGDSSDRAYSSVTLSPENAEAVAHSLYSIHLALMLLWTRDDTPEHKVAQSALRRACSLLATEQVLIPHDAVLAGLTAVDTIVGPLLRADQPDVGRAGAPDLP